MKSRIWLVLAGLITVALLAAPALGLAKGKGKDHWGNYHAMERDKLIKELKLSPEIAKQFQAVSEKFHQNRKTIIEALEKYDGQLKVVMTAPKPDEAKIKDLVGHIVSEQDKLLNSFKAQRDVELVLLSPEQQANYFLIMAKWHHKMMEKWEHGKGKKEKMKKKPEKK